MTSDQWCFTRKKEVSPEPQGWWWCSAAAAGWCFANRDVWLVTTAPPPGCCNSVTPTTTICTITTIQKCIQGYRWWGKSLSFAAFDDKSLSITTDSNPFDWMSADKTLIFEIIIPRKCALFNQLHTRKLMHGEKTDAGKFCADFRLLLQLLLGPANPCQLWQTWRKIFQAFAAFFSSFQMVWQSVRGTWWNPGLTLCLSYCNHLIFINSYYGTCCWSFFTKNWWQWLSRGVLVGYIAALAFSAGTKSARLLHLWHLWHSEAQKISWRWLLRQVLVGYVVASPKLACNQLT